MMFSWKTKEAMKANCQDLAGWDPELVAFKIRIMLSHVAYLQTHKRRVDSASLTEDERDTLRRLIAMRSRPEETADVVLMEESTGVSTVETIVVDSENEEERRKIHASLFSDSDPELAALLKPDVSIVSSTVVLRHA